MSKLQVSVRTADFSVDEENQRLMQSTQADASSPVGAVVNFIGCVRQSSQGSDLLHFMELEHYPGMTESSIHDVIERALKRWTISSATVIHRVGVLAVGEQIVYVGVASPHRQEAFDACGFIMDFLKSEAPFWKKEHFSSGATAWVGARESDVKALDKWR